MPWTLKTLPDQFKVLPTEAQEIAVEAANDGLKKFDGDEARAIRYAWGAVKQAGYAKGEDGNWHKVQIEREHVESYAAGEDAKAAQARRSKQYGIAIKEGGHVTKPAEWAHVADGQFLDPVNYRYPCPDAEQTRVAARYWGKPKNQAQYSSGEPATINERLAAMKKNFEIGEDSEERSTEPFAELRQAGKHWGLTLRHVAFLGGDVPAVKGLKGIKDLGPGEDLKDVEIFAAGEHKGKRYSEADLNIIAANFHALKGVHDVPLVMAAGHDEDGFAKVLKTEGLPSLGWVEDVRRIGSKLVASFRQVPGIAKDLIKSGRFIKRSVSLYPDFVFGEDGQEAVSIFFEGGSGKEGYEMGETRFTEEELKAKVVAETKDLKAEIEKLTEERDTKQKALEEHLEADTEKKIKSFCESLTKDRLAPVLVDDAKAVLARLDDTEPVKFSEKEDPVSALDKAIKFLEATLKAAKDEKLFLPAGEAGTGGEFTGPGQGEFTEDKKLIEEMKTYSSRVPQKKS